MLARVMMRLSTFSTPWKTFFGASISIPRKIPPTTAMTEILVKILIELFSTLALGTHQVKQGRLSEYAT